MKICYLNTDLDLVAPSDLTALAADLCSKGLLALHVDTVGDGRWRAHFEVDSAATDPAEAVGIVLKVIDVLPPATRAVWDACSVRAFSIGFSRGKQPRVSEQVLPAPLLARIAAVGADVAVTIYAPDA